MLKILKRIKKIKEKLKTDDKGSFYCFSYDDYEKFIEYKDNDAKSICNYYVKQQKFYLNNEHKDIINKWSFKYYRPLNMVLRSLIKVSKKKEDEYNDFTYKLSKLIESSKGLEDNVILYRGELNVDLNRFKINQINEFIGFTSTSFSKKVGLKFTKIKNNENRYLICIKAKMNTKGISINGYELGKYKDQCEWLLNTKTKYITKGIDKNNKIIYIELL